MIGTLVVSHGNVAESLVSVTTRIIGPCHHVNHFCVGWEDDMEAARTALGQRIQQIDHGHGVLLLTDMFGGTPTNISLTFHQPGKVEIITGVNLPMIMKAMTLPKGMAIRDAALQLRQQAQKAIYIASELL
jgi:PTS system mannose-specific IIA component